MQRQSKHPDIQDYADDGIGPCKSIDIDAFTSAFAIPSRPVGRDRVALEDGDKDECDTTETVDGYSCPEESLGDGFWEDPKEEEQKRKLQKGNLEEV